MMGQSVIFYQAFTTIGILEPVLHGSWGEKLEFYWVEPDRSEVFVYVDLLAVFARTWVAENIPGLPSLTLMCVS